MNILFDTNILIPLEPKTISDIEPETHGINGLYKKLKELNYHIFLLDLQKKDIESEKDFNRRETRISMTQLSEEAKKWIIQQAWS